MKRLWVILGALAVICALSVTEASAQKLAKRDLAWLDQTASSWNTGRFKDRTAITNSGTGIDTLQYFSLLGCVKPTTSLMAKYSVRSLAPIPARTLAQVISMRSVLPQLMHLRGVLFRTNQFGAGFRQLQGNIHLMQLTFIQ